MAGGVVQVYVFRDGEFIGTEVFMESEVVIGRDPDVADLVLESSDVSRQHAALLIDDEDIVIRDMGSTNGIYINSEKVEESPVDRLDDVVIGDFSLKIKRQRSKRAGAGGTASGAKAPRRESPATGRRGRRRGSDSAARSARSERGERRRSSGERRRGAERRGDERRAEGSSSGSRRAPRREASDSREAPRRKPERRRERRRERPAERRSPRREKQAAEEERASFFEGAETHADLEPGNLEQLESMDTSLGADTQADLAALESGPLNRDMDDDFDSGFDDGPPPAELSDDEVDEDELEDLNYVPPYSLVSRLREEDQLVAKRGKGKGVTPQVEVLTLHPESVGAVTMLKPGDTFWIGPKLGMMRRRKARDLPTRERLLTVKRGGEVVIELPERVKGTLYKGGKQKQALASAGGKSRKAAVAGTMKEGDILDLVEGPTTYHVRFVYPPAPIKGTKPKDAPSLFDDRPFGEKVRSIPLIAKSFMGSSSFHVGMLVLYWAVANFAPEQSRAKPTDEFVEVDITAELELEEPEPEPEPEPEEEPQPVREKQPKKMEAAPSKKPPKTGGTSKKPAGVLGLLSKGKSSAAPGPASAVAAVSNLKSVKVPGGSSGFRVSGLKGKLPTSSLSLGGGGGGVMTKTGRSLLGGGGGAGRLSGKGTRKVGGMVLKAPKAMKPSGQGHLDRDEIQKVINKNIGQIQRCYERELLKTPGLSGKVSVQWTIATSGRVSSTRQVQSSLNTSVVNCIMGKIRGWKFPQPKGGSVIVTYPFIFKSIGF